ncbi:MAG: hypothetical protein JWM77_3297 [Rhodospirillales bacterium]|nr:hypothetical protein [Rhodospirillales bacterium]
MSIRRTLFGLAAAALLAPGFALAADEKPATGSLTSTTSPTPPMGVLTSPDQLPRQPRAQSSTPVHRLSPSEIYARDHARRVPSFATVRPQMRKPLPGEGPDQAKEAKETKAASARAKPPNPARPVAAKPALDGILDATPAAEKPANDRPAPKKKIVKKTTTTTTTTAATVVTPSAPMTPEFIVRPPTAAAIYEHAAVQYRDLRRRDLEMVRQLLPPQQYAAKLAAIEAAYHPY